MPTEGPFRFVQGIAGEVNDLHVIFTGTGGSLSDVAITDGPAPSSAVASGNSVGLAWVEPLPTGTVVGFTVRSMFTPIRVAGASWTKDGDTVGDALPKPPPKKAVSGGLFRVEIGGCPVPEAVTRELLDSVEQGTLIGIAGRDFAVDPILQCRIFVGEYSQRPLPGFSRPDLLVFAVPPVPPGRHAVKVLSASRTLSAGELVVRAGYAAPANSATLVEEFIAGSEAVFLGLEGLMKARVQRIGDAAEREELMLYVGNFASSSRALFHFLKLGVLGSDPETLNKLALRIVITGILPELSFYIRELNLPGDGDGKPEKGQWIEEDIKALIEAIPDGTWGLDLSYLKKVLNKLVSLILGRLGKKKGGTSAPTPLPNPTLLA